MFEAKPRAVEKKESSTETGTCAVSRCECPDSIMIRERLQDADSKHCGPFLDDALSVLRCPEVQYAVSWGLML